MTAVFIFPRSPVPKQFKQYDLMFRVVNHYDLDGLIKFNVLLGAHRSVLEAPHYVPLEKRRV